jgi:predicted anti-sigma-YlaC factor YlaD
MDRAMHFTMRTGPGMNGMKKASRSVVLISLLFAMFAVGTGCGSVRRAFLNSAALALSGEDAVAVYTSDNDPELIREALPFGLKTYESLLAADPSSRSLHLTAAVGFISYARAFLDDQAAMLIYENLARSRHLKERALKMYLRGRDYALNGLELDFPDFVLHLREDPQNTLGSLTEKEVSFLYWAAAGWAGAISSNPEDMALVAEIPFVEAMMERALELDEDFGEGTLHEFFISWEGARSEAMGGDPHEAWHHYLLAVEQTRGLKATPHVALAETLAVRQQDQKIFRSLLEKALAVDEDAVPKWRLQNILAKEKAGWLLENASDLFLDYKEAEP